MCKAFSCLVSERGKVYWKKGIDSHDSLLSEYKLNESTFGKLRFARIEIIPDHNKRFPYLYPDEKWKLIIDEKVKPDWICPTDEQLAWDAWRDWKKEVYNSFNLAQILNPVNPLRIKPQKLTKLDMENLRKWASVRDSVWASVRDSVRDSVGASVGASVWDSVGALVWDSARDSVRASVWDSVRDSVGALVGASVWDSVRDSVWDSVRDSVWAYIGSAFTDIQKEKSPYHYHFQPAVALWERGFVPSFDGKIWRLHSGSGENAKIVYEISKEDLCQK